MRAWKTKVPTYETLELCLKFLFHGSLSVYLFGATPTTDTIQAYVVVDARSPHRAVYEACTSTCT